MNQIENLKIWNLVSQVPVNFLSPIQGGKLKGKTDINPQWRLMAMTQAFGMVGKGWDYTIKRTWEIPNPATGEVMCFAEVAVKYCLSGEWSNEFSGIGGSMLIEKNKNGIQCNDDGYKMAVTDALSVAFKAIGIASDIYLGNFDGSKYMWSYTYAYQEPVAQVKQVLDDERFSNAVQAIKMGQFDKVKLLTEYELTDQQRQIVQGL